MEWNQSQQMHEEASRFLVGGVNSPVRSFAKVGRHPILAKSAKGAKIWDLDGNEYFDFVMSYGPHLLGHGNDAVLSAVQESLSQGLCWGMTGELEILWAEKMLSKVPGAEKVRALNSGTEACMTAIRLARGFTGRDNILKFSGHYHGHIDALLVDSGSGVATLSEELVADSAGLPQGFVQHTRVLEFNNEDVLKDFFQKEGQSTAAVILEPIMGNMGVIPAKASFLKLLRELCSMNGVLLIFDEVMSGFRVHENSAQGLYDIQPDLSCFGKVVGGGMPLSALAGPAKFMDHLAPLGPVYQAGTLSGNPVAMSAGLAMLQEIERVNPYPQLEQLGTALEQHLQTCFEKKSIAARVQRVGSMISVFFRQEEVQNAAHSRDIDMELFKKYFWSALENGIMLPPSPFEAYFLSNAHIPAQDEIFSRWEKCIGRI